MTALLSPFIAASVNESSNPFPSMLMSSNLTGSKGGTPSSLMPFVKWGSVVASLSFTHSTKFSSKSHCWMYAAVKIILNTLEQYIYFFLYSGFVKYQALFSFVLVIKNMIYLYLSFFTCLPSERKLTPLIQFYLSQALSQ